MTNLDAPQQKRSQHETGSI